MTPGTELCRREDAERLFENMVSGYPPPSLFPLPEAPMKIQSHLAYISAAKGT